MRNADATRRAYTDGVLTVIDDVAARVAPHDPRSARVRTFNTSARGPAALCSSVAASTVPAQ
jgi:hypothetical protein